MSERRTLFVDWIAQEQRGDSYVAGIGTQIWRFGLHDIEVHGVIKQPRARAVAKAVWISMTPQYAERIGLPSRA